MIYPKRLISAKIQERYKRFLADVELQNKEKITIHVANTGRMTSCYAPNWEVMLFDSKNPKRKYRYSLELTHNGKTWICVNTMRSNELAKEGILKNQISELANYSSLRQEVKYGENSRIDILLENENEKCYVEVKHVTLVENNVAKFPDAVSTRGTKHLQELIRMKKQGHRAVMLYLVFREDAKMFEPATDIDPKYSEAFYNAKKQGVEILIYQIKISPISLEIDKKINLKKAN